MRGRRVRFLAERAILMMRNGCDDFTHAGCYAQASDQEEKLLNPEPICERASGIPITLPRTFSTCRRGGPT